MKTALGKITYILLLTVVCILSACQDQMESDVAYGGKMRARFTTSELSGAENNDPSSRIASISGYLFDSNDKLALALTDLPINEQNECLLPVTPNGAYYFVANGDGVSGLSDVAEKTTTLADFLQIINNKAQVEGNPVVMTGNATAKSNQQIKVSLCRAMSRVDIHPMVSGLSVEKVVISQVADKGFLWEQTSVSSPDGTSFSTKDFDFTQQPITGKKEGLLYLHEQQNPQKMKVEIWATYKEGKRLFRTELPATIKRNTLYTLKIYGSGPNIKVGVESEGWEIGEEDNSVFSPISLIDQANSVLHDAELNQEGDTLFIPYWENEIKLVLNTTDQYTIKTTGTLNKATVDTQPNDNATNILIENQQKPLGAEAQYAYANLYDKENFQVGRIVLVFKNHPVKLTGILNFENSTEYDFNRYAEGEFGVLTLPENMEAKVQFADGEDPWMTLRKSTKQSNQLRILGGWKPNDPKGNGSVQSAQLVIKETNGKHQEIYTIRRKNWSIPVVNVAGIWWSKYNLKGNAQSYKDQIRVTEDPAQQAEKTLFEYLNSCTDEEYLKVLGSAYQSGSPEGLTLTCENGRWHYLGFTTSNPTLMCKVDPKSMAPEGFELPTKADFEKLVWGTNCDLTDRTFTNETGIGHLKGFQKNIALNGGTTSIHHHRLYFTKGDENTRVGDEFVWYAGGHQSAASGNINMWYVFYATVSDNGLWTHNCNKNHKFSFEQYGGNSNHKTHFIRCRKSPVEYMY